MSDLLSTPDDRPLADRITAYVQSRGHVSFVELERKFPEILGDDSICFVYPKLFMWWGLSGDSVDLIGELIKNERIFIWPATELTYLQDGKVPTIPVAKSVREYRQPRWLPVTLHHRPATERDFPVSADKEYSV